MNQKIIFYNLRNILVTYSQLFYWQKLMKITWPRKKLRKHCSILIADHSHLLYKALTTSLLLFSPTRFTQFNIDILKYLYILPYSTKNTSIPTLYSTNTQVHFIWIPSHCSIHNNELVDQAAKKHYKKYHKFDKNNIITIQWYSEWIEPTTILSNLIYITGTQLTIWSEKSNCTLKSGWIILNLPGITLPGINFSY